MPTYFRKQRDNCFVSASTAFLFYYRKKNPSSGLCLELAGIAFMTHANDSEINANTYTLLIDCKMHNKRYTKISDN